MNVSPHTSKRRRRGSSPQKLTTRQKQVLCGRLLWEDAEGNPEASAVLLENAMVPIKTLDQTCPFELHSDTKVRVLKSKGSRWTTVGFRRHVVLAHRGSDNRLTIFSTNTPDFCAYTADIEHVVGAQLPNRKSIVEMLKLILKLRENDVDGDQYADWTAKWATKRQDTSLQPLVHTALKAYHERVDRRRRFYESQWIQLACMAFDIPPTTTASA